MSRRRTAFLVLLLLVVAGILWFVSHGRAKPSGPDLNTDSSSSILSDGALAPAGADNGVTNIYAHNIDLQKGPQFRIYLRWLNGEMMRTRPNVDPSFDNPDSFVLVIQKGVIHANLGDIGNFLNTTSFPLKNMVVRGQGNQVKLTGTVHKFHLPLPVELLSSVSATADGRIHLHVDKINLLRIPLKGLLGGLHVELADVVGTTPMAGVEVSDNDIFLTTTQLLPPPRIRGLLSSITVVAPDLVLIYGNADDDETTLARWHNFLRFEGGTLNFGKLSMHPVDLTLIDASNDVWFDLDLFSYQSQLLNAYSRMTPKQGLEIFLPDPSQVKQKKQDQTSITMEWLQNRSKSLPAEVKFK